MFTVKGYTFALAFGKQGREGRAERGRKKEEFIESLTYREKVVQELGCFLGRTLFFFEVIQG